MSNTQHTDVVLPPEARLIVGQGGLQCLAIDTAQCKGEIFLHGAHLTQWQPTGNQPVLWMSESSMFKAGQPIRGGVPICFPWFGPKLDDPAAPPHGWARLKAWTLDSVTNEDANGTVVQLSLDHAADKTWPHNCALRYKVSFGKRLTMSFSVRNLGKTAMPYQEALHTYLAVKDVRKVAIKGLTGTTYIDKLADSARKTQGEAPITIEAETDRVYVNTAGTVELEDPGLGRRITIDKMGSRATVVWNPWVAKAARMPDFGDNEWPGMVCIETVNAADNAIELPPSHMHTISASISVTNLWI